MDAESWNALAACTTAVVAIATVVVAGTYARKQVNEARQLREEQAQPYVVAMMDVVRHGSGFVDLVIKNFGTTGANDIRIEITPPPARWLIP